MRQKFTLRFLMALFCMYGGSNLFAQEGTLDPTFGTGGKVWEPTVSQFLNTRLRGQDNPKVLVQSDGKILMINSITSGTDESSMTYRGTKITRYLPGGTLDAGFGTGGSVSMPSGNIHMRVRDAYMLPDNKFLVLVAQGRPIELDIIMWVYKFNADGTPDLSFDGDGKASVFLVTSSVAIIERMTVQPDGKIVVVGAYHSSVFIIRLNANGSRDTSFDGDGFQSSVGGIGTDVAIQQDGKIVVSAFRSEVTVNQAGLNVTSLNRTIYRFNPDGSVDKSFGVNGRVSKPFPQPSELATNITIEPTTGKIIAVGYYESINNRDSSGLWVARYLLDGTLDPSFDGDGEIYFPPIESVFITDIGIQQDGKIVFGGTILCNSACPNEGYVNMVMYRLNNNGTPDESFAPGGKVALMYADALLPSGQGSLDVGTSFASQGNKLIVGGLSRYQGITKMFMVRLNTTSPLVEGNANPTSPTHVFIPAKIEAEAWSAMRGVQTEPTTDEGGGVNVGYIDNMDWMEYNITVPVTGLYTVKFRVASPSIHNPHIQLTEGGNLLATVNIPNTGGFQNWQTVTTQLRLTQGNHTIRLTNTSGGLWNINWLEFIDAQNMYTTIPAKIEAEWYSNMSGIQTEPTSDAGGGLNVGWQETGDWMEYKINVPKADVYYIYFRVAAQNRGQKFTLSSSQNSFAFPVEVDVPLIGGFQNWYTIAAGIFLYTGEQTIRISTTTGGGWNLNWLEFSTRQPNGDAVMLPAKIEAENYLFMNGIEIEPTQDAGGGMNVGWQDNGDGMTYYIFAPVRGLYNVSFRVATPFSGVQFQTMFGLTTSANVSVPNTGGFQNWQTVTVPIFLEWGAQHFTLYTKNAAGGWNLNWMEFALAPVGTVAATKQEQLMQFDVTNVNDLQVYPNPVRDKATLVIKTENTGLLQVDVVSVASGAVVKSYQVQKAAEGVFQYSLSTYGLPAGSYVLRASMKGWSGTKQIIKQ